jgi:hypothetical protein
MPAADPARRPITPLLAVLSALANQRDADLLAALLQLCPLTELTLQAVPHWRLWCVMICRFADAESLLPMPFRI